MSHHPVIKKDDIKFTQKSHWLNKNVSFKQALLSRQAGMSKCAVNLNVLGPDMESTVSFGRSPIIPLPVNRRDHRPCPLLSSAVVDEESNKHPSNEDSASRLKK